MKETPCEQGSEVWRRLRAGIPTASEFHRVVTPTGKLSKQSRDYMAWLLAERVLGQPLETKQSVAMIRGTQFEADAVSFFENLCDLKISLCGFVTNDAGTIGASPDRWAGETGQWELKVPMPQTQIAYFLAQSAIERCEAEIERLTMAGPDTKEELAELQLAYTEALQNSLEAEYRVQTQGQLFVTERDWADLLAYSPEGLPPVYVHLKRNEPFIAILGRSVTEFSRTLEEQAARLMADGIIPKPEQL
jgi:hypothetical protein